MPVYNGERYLEEAIGSVMAQTFTDFELILSDNASTDGTQEICREWAERDPRVRYVRNSTNTGAARNYNRLVELAQGEFFKWFAHDDLIAPTYLAKSVAALTAAPPNVVLCSPRRRHLNPDGSPVGDDYYRGRDVHGPDHSQAGISFADLLAMPGTNMFLFVQSLIRTEALRRTRLIGSWISADLVLAVELRLQGEFIDIPEVLYFQRIKARTDDLENRLTKRGQAAWYDPEGSRIAALFPNINLFWQRLVAIHRIPMPVGDKIACYAAMRHHVAFRTKRRFRQKRARIVGRLADAVVRAMPANSAPLRLVYFATGVLKGERERLRIALLRTPGGIPPELESFARDRLIPLAHSLRTGPFPPEPPPRPGTAPDRA
jgi:glycosyltransferase involved in cell wall biosynthesis